MGKQGTDASQFPYGFIDRCKNCGDVIKVARRSSGSGKVWKHLASNETTPTTIWCPGSTVNDPSLAEPHDPPPVVKDRWPDPGADTARDDLLSLVAEYEDILHDLKEDVLFIFQRYTTGMNQEAAQKVAHVREVLKKIPVF